MQNEFPSTAPLIYLNAAAQSLCPKRVLVGIQQHRSEYEKNPTEGWVRAWGKLWEMQKRLANHFKSDPKEIFLRTNITSVLNTFILGVPLPDASEILVGEWEYGAILNVCRFRAEKEKHSLRLLRLPGSIVAAKNINREKLIEHFASQLTSKTKMVVLSHVVGGTGLQLPLESFAKETRKRGIFLVVDGAYAAGAVPVSFEKLRDVDFYGVSLYKWMMGPKGTAFGWVPSRNQHLLQPSSAGWTTFEAFEHFKAFGDGSRFQESFMLSGLHDFAPFFAVNEMLDLWNSLSEESIYRQRHELMSCLEDRVALELGWNALKYRDMLSGPILSFQLPPNLQPEGKKIARKVLSDLKIQLSVSNLRGLWFATFSPHVWNTTAEIEETIDRLKKLVLYQNRQKNT